MKDVDVVIPIYDGYDETVACLESVLQTIAFDWARVVAVNDGSPNPQITAYLRQLAQQHPQLVLLENDSNLGFVATANRGMEHDRSRDVLLLNSDVEIRDPPCRRRLLDCHEEGVSSYGLVSGNPVARVDGYCFLIDSHLYRTFKLDEEYQWWWSVTKLQAAVLNEGYRVKGYFDHDDQIYHFGGRSGPAFKCAKGMDEDGEKIVSWFNGMDIDEYQSISTQVGCHDLSCDYVRAESYRQISSWGSASGARSQLDPGDL